MKVLYVTTIGSTMNFFRSVIRKMLDMGHTVEIAANESDRKVPDCYREWGCRIHPISCSRSPLSGGNLSAVRQIRDLTRQNGYDVVHCHTPVAAMCTRMSCIGARKRGTKVYYTAHGFHFYKGAPLKNWLLFYPIEKLCAHFTDVLITINREDRDRAQRKLKAKSVKYVPGVGIEMQKFQNNGSRCAEKRKELNLPEDAFVLFSVGELNENKNHQVVIRALSRIGRSNIHYLIAGAGSKADDLAVLAKEMGVEQRVHLLGYRQDVAQLYAASDCFVFPSYREGLSVSMMEAMASGLPVVASAIRGNVDMIDPKGGILVRPNDAGAFARAIGQIMDSEYTRMGQYNADKARMFAVEQIDREMLEIYN